MIWALILIIVYVLSVFWAKVETTRFYEVEVYNINPSISDLFFVFIPVVNTIYAIVYYLTRKPTQFKPARSSRFISKFFKIEERVN